MASKPADHDANASRTLAVVSGLLVATAGVAVAEGALLAAGLAIAAAFASWLALRRTGQVTLTEAELDRLRDAEVALAQASDPITAAQELAEHAIALLGARSAVVLIEGIGDTVRVSAGPTRTEDVYGSGSKMRLLDDAGVPCGSIAVSERADGKPYGPRHERILDALAERVSTTLHRVSLLADVGAERRKLDDLITSSSDGIFSVASDFRVRSWNPAMARITGVSATKALGDHISSSFQPWSEDGKPLWGSNDPGRSGTNGSAVLVRVGEGDDTTWLRCSYSPLSDGGYVVIARDDTERKKLQDDKDGWIAQVSHELRTPLTPIKGFLQTLSRRDDQLSTVDRRKIYEVMLREERRLENLVDALLRSTQLDEANLVVVPRPVDWRAVVEEVVGDARTQDPGRTYELRLPGGLGPALTDESMAEGILSNLLSNAQKYAGPDSAVEVEVAVDEETGDLVTSVIDHGPGVPRGDRERIFQKFTRLGDHLTRPQQGVGLGLYIARQSVDRLQGRIWVEPTPGGGATFRFTLPPSDRPAAGDGGLLRAPRRSGRLSARRIG